MTPCDVFIILCRALAGASPFAVPFGAPSGAASPFGAAGSAPVAAPKAAPAAVSPFADTSAFGAVPSAAASSPFAQSGAANPFGEATNRDKKKAALQAVEDVGTSHVPFLLATSSSFTSFLEFPRPIRRRACLL